nr:O-antigen ligase family protein [Sphingobium sp. AS12]
MISVSAGLVALIASNSRTPLLAFFVSLGFVYLIGFLVKPTGWQRRFALSLRWFITIGTLFFITVVMPVMISIVMYLINRDLTLTGRLRLWKYAVEIGADRPWFGAGFKSFWTDKLTLDILVLHQHWGERNTTRAMTSNAHNGYLDVWLELGFIGLGLFVIFWISFLVRSVAAYREGHSSGYWALLLWSFMTIYYIGNSTVFQHLDFSWFSVVLAFLLVSNYKNDWPAKLNKARSDASITVGEALGPQREAAAASLAQ